MKLYELKIADETDEIFAISLVESPAIESDFVYFGKEEIHFASVDTEQRLILGPILIADKPILRVDGEGQPYHVFLKKDTVKRLAQNYLKNKYTDKATLEHEKSIKGVHLVESWIKEGSFDKSNKYGLNLPDGTWVGVFSVDKSPEGEKIWNDYVKTGKVKGFSIEGTFTHDLVHASKIEIDKEIDDMSEEEAEVFLSTLRALIKDDRRFKSKKKIEMESYSDYPDGVKNNAKRALEWADKNGWGSCGTPVGKQRANQLAKGEPISVETIKRMYSYVSRHEVDLETSKSYSDGCGKLMMDSWGGLAAGRWAHNKLRELGLLEETELPSIPNSSYPGEVAKRRKKMTPNNVFQNIQKFVATEVSVDEFLSLLKESNRTHKMRVTWMTEGSADGSGKAPHRTTHLLWWDADAYVGGDAGGSDTKELQDQFNLLVTPGTNNWRTLSYQNITTFSYKDRLYKLK